MSLFPKRPLPVLMTLGLLSLILLSSTGCKTSRGLTHENVRIKSRSGKYLLKKLNDHRVGADWLSAKAKVVFRSEEETRRFISYVRVQRDSLIWMNFKKTGVEAARMLIRPDSIFIIDRLNNQYAQGSLEDLRQRFELPFRDLPDHELFRYLQEVFFGNPVFFRVRELNADTSRGLYYLQGEAQQLKSEYWLSGHSHELLEMAFTDLRAQRQAVFRFDNHQPVEGKQNFAYFRNIIFNSPEAGGVSLEMDFKQVELDVPKTIRFEIPDHYERVE